MPPKTVCEAIGIPHAATDGDQEIRDRILVARERYAVAMLDGILGEDPLPDVPWSVAYLRA